VAHVEITSTQLQSIGSSPKTIIAAPGTDKVIDLLSISVYGKFGTTAYDFSGDLEFDCNSTVFATVPALTANSSQDFVVKPMIGGGSSNPLTLSSNQALAFTGGNPTQGDGTFFVNAYYRILTVGTTF
jgi:DNA-binding transcriptional regulator LsrR (DeoR family)